MKAFQRTCLSKELRPSLIACALMSFTKLNKIRIDTRLSDPVQISPSDNELELMDESKASSLKAKI